MNYEDFEVEIGPGQGLHYPVSLVRSPAGEVRGATMTFPFDEATLKINLLSFQNAILRSRGTHRKSLTPEETSVQRFGQSLFEALITGEIRNRYDLSRQKMIQEGKGLRLKLRVTAPPMTIIPWEFLFDPQRKEYVALSSSTPIVRYLDLTHPIQPRKASLPLRILAMIASPQDFPDLQIQDEKRRIETALSTLIERKLVDLVWLEGQTCHDLQRAMRRGPWHIFHFIGHGGFDSNRDEGVIVFADEQNLSHELSATHLARILADNHLQLAVLNSCYSARSSQHDIFSSTASILVQRGIPAALAMQYEISDQAAIRFARSFYEALTDGSPVDVAVSEARKAIDTQGHNTIEWGTPVLYTGCPDGNIFDVITRPNDPGKKPNLGDSASPPPEPPFPIVRGGDYKGMDLSNRDLSGKDLREADFSEAQLRGANFSKALLQGTNFTDADLSDSNFSYAQAGLRRYWSYFVIFCLGLASLLSAFPAAIIFTFGWNFLSGSQKAPSNSTLIRIGIGTVSLTMFIRTVLFLLSTEQINYIPWHVYIGMALIALMAFAMVVVAINDPKSGAGSLAVWVIILLTFLALIFYFKDSFNQFEYKLADWFPTIAKGISNVFPGVLPTADGSWVSGFIGAIIGSFFGCHFARLAMIGDKKFDWLWKFYIQFVTSGGTNFQRARLTNANFTSAMLKGANLKNASMIGTIWCKTQSLQYANVENSYLASLKVRQLVVDGKVNSPDYSGLHLEGVNLEGKDLSGIQFVNSNLSHANLRHTTLNRANLSQAKLSGADLWRAHLTGAIIENWFIDKTTNLEEVDSQYIFLTESVDSVTGVRERRPILGNFKPREFEQHFRKEPDVADLSIHGDSNPQAVYTAFEKLRKDTRCDFQGIERKGDDFLIKINVSKMVGVDFAVRKFYQEYESAKKNSSQYSNSEAPGNIIVATLRAFELV